jgi:hypothetical protein
MSLRHKIDNIVSETLPKGAKYTLSLTQSGIGDTFIVRIATPAWKTLSPFVRVLKIQNALHRGLTSNERKKILRVNVFSPDQLGRFLLQRAVSRSIQKSRLSTAIPWDKVIKKLSEKNAQKKLRTQAALKSALAKLRNG